jgi:WD40 repeat protein
LVGTKYGNIFEINEKTSSIQSLIKGHAEGELWGLAVHPNKEVFATGSYDGFLKFWDVRTKVYLNNWT